MPDDESFRMIAPPDFVDAMNDDEILAWLTESRKLMEDAATIGAWSVDELQGLLRDEELLAGPYSRSLGNGRTQFYAYIRAR